jgi:hypothetical protein
MFNFVKWYNGIIRNDEKKDIELARRAFKELDVIHPIKEFILLKNSTNVYTYAIITSVVEAEIVLYVTDIPTEGDMLEVYKESSTRIATVNVPHERNAHRVWLELDEKFQRHGLCFPLGEEQRSVFSVAERKIVEI